LNVIRLRLPALRERREDVAMLTRHFLQQSAQQLGVESKRISEAALATLVQFQFPGNVRQLENICHWLTVMAPAQVIEPKDLPPEVSGTVSLNTTESVSMPASQLDDPTHDAPVVSAAAHAMAPVATQPGVTTAGFALSDWESGLEAEAMALLAAGREDVWDAIVNRVEARLIQTALHNTRGRRIEAAQKLGIGRNTITRKIQELGL
jgi:two-component system nitrogen regulation response regulator GlnG